MTDHLSKHYLSKEVDMELSGYTSSTYCKSCLEVIVFPVIVLIFAGAAFPAFRA